MMRAMSPRWSTRNVMAVAVLVTTHLLGCEPWRNAVPSTTSATPVFFTASEGSVVRMSDGSVELANEKGRTRLALAGPARIFAPGPVNTIAFQSESVPFVFQSMSADTKLAERAPIPAVKYVVTGEATPDLGTPLLIVSTSGVATLWSTRGTSLDRGPQLVKSLMNMKVSRFSEGNKHLYVSYLDGGIDRFELASGTPTLSLPARGMVKAVAAAAGTVVVADDQGVRWFDENSTKPRANLALPNVVAVEYGHLPKGSHATQGWLALTSTTTSTTANSEHTLHVISADQGGRDLSRSRIPLPQGEKPVALTTTRREILVATDKGGVWQLRIQ